MIQRRSIAGCAAAALLSLAAGVASGSDAQVARAVREGDRAALESLIKQRVDVNVPEVDGTTALHWAVRADDVATVARLIRAGAHANAANRYGVTPLALAAGLGSAAVIDALLKAGADARVAGPE